MKIIEPGHIYQLEHRDGSGAGLLVFVNREPGTEHEGTQTQDVLRALIDRTQHCDRCLRWDGNDKIIYHLRMALALHEARALLRKTEKGVIKPEAIPTADDGHFALGEPKTTDYCERCHHSPESAEHYGLTDNPHEYIDPRVGSPVDRHLGYGLAPKQPDTAPYRCNVPMCGDSGVCDECRKRGAR